MRGLLRREKRMQSLTQCRFLHVLALHIAFLKFPFFQCSYSMSKESTEELIETVIKNMGDLGGITHLFHIFD